MPIGLAWDDDSKQIINVTVDGRWTWEELEAALRQTIAMMDSVSHRVHFIIDIRRGHLDIASALGQAQKAATPQTHRNEGLKVVVGANWMVRKAYAAYRSVTRALGKDQQFLFANSLEDARDLIRQRA